MAIINLLRYSIPEDFNKSILVDTNVWLLLYSDLHESMEREIAAYSNFFSEILDKDIPICITGHILSEISNVLLRYDFNSIKEEANRTLDFKRDYVGSDAYKITVDNINRSIESIFEYDNIHKINDSFESTNIKNVQNHFQSLDWNDAYSYELAIKKGLSILSHDRDFRKLDFSNIDLIQLNHY